MAMKKLPGARLLFWSAFVIVLLDIATKVVIRSLLPVGASVPVLPFLQIVNFQNTGISFGLLQFAFLRWVYVALALGVAIAIALSCTHGKLRQHLVAWGLILGGALGNALDRIFLGTVTDFVHFGIGSFAWPAFNVADSALTIGALIIILHSWKREK
jgi:signal peptidase II